MYLSRLTLRRDPDVAALRSLIDPEDAGARTDAHHRLIWTVFAGDPDAPRDYLWRADGQGRFMVLSARPPQDAGLFAPPEVKTFAPDLRKGDRLAFVLRVNATRSAPAASGQRGKVQDIVMQRLHAVPGEQRASMRMPLAQEAAEAWWAAQGARHGFSAQVTTVEDYTVQALPTHRGKRKGQPQFGILDLSGRIEVTEPDALIARIGQGFGRAKAFGCGLMLIRRA